MTTTHASSDCPPVVLARTALRAAALMALIASMSACSEGAPPPPPTGGTGGTGATGGAGTGGFDGTGGSAGTGGAAGTGGMGGTGGVGGIGGAGGIGGTGGAGGFVGMACLNDGDRQVIATTTPNLRWQAADCGTLCQGRTEPQFLDCMSSCFAGAVAELSSECTSCYANLGWCAGAACNTWCANTTDACGLDCINDSIRCPGYDVCLTTLNQCAGRDSLDCLDDT